MTTGTESTDRVFLALANPVRRELLRILAEGPLAALRPGMGRFHVAGRLEANHWQGRRRVQLVLEDAAPTRPAR